MSEQQPTNPNSDNDIYVPYKGKVEKWSLEGDPNEQGIQTAVRPETEFDADGNEVQATKSVGEQGRNPEVQAELERQYLEAMGHEALEQTGVKAPEDGHDHSQQIPEVAKTASVESNEEVGKLGEEDSGEDAANAIEQAAQAESLDAAEANRIKTEYDRRVDGLLDQDGVHQIETNLSRLEDEMDRLSYTLRPIRLQDASEELRATMASIENDTYGVESARTKLKQIENELVTVDSLMRAATEAGIQDVKSIAKRASEQIADVNTELQTMQGTYESVSRGESATVGPDADTGEVRKELQVIAADFETFAESLEAERAALQEYSGALHKVVGQLSDLIRQTYSGQLETVELHALQATLANVVNGLSERSIDKKTAPLIETTKGHLRAIKQQRNWEQ